MKKLMIPMKKFTLTLVIMMAMILLLPLHTIAAEEYDEDPTPYDTEEWYRGDTGELIDDIDAFILENVASNVNGGQINPINPTDLEETNESKDLSITLPMYNTTYAHTIVGSGATGRTNLGLETKTCLQHWQTGKTCSCTDKVTTVFNIQGACADEEYAYFAFYVYYRKTDVKEHKNVTICQKNCL